MDEHGKPTRPARGLRTSSVVLAAACFLALNVVLMVCNPLKNIDPESLPLARTWVWWAAHNYKEEPKAPDVVLLGSSLLMNPVWQNEADFLNKDFDIVATRRTQYLESALSRTLSCANLRCFNFALPGAFVSDDYMIIRTMFEEKKPKIVVLALSPRDFIENGLRSPAFSPHFRYLKRFTSLDDLMDVAMPHFWQRFGYYTDKLLYCWGRRLELQVLSQHALASFTDFVLGPSAIAATAAKPVTDPKDVANAIYQDELVKGVWIAKPNMTPPYNPGGVDEYKRRYKDSKRIDNQQKWLEMTLDLCRQKDIQVIVLNMPLTDTNLTVYPTGVYDYCVAAIRSTAEKKGVRYVDLMNSGKFELSDFTDMWHMNARGGRKVLDTVAAEITMHKNLSVALTAPSADPRRSGIAAAGTAQ